MSRGSQGTRGAFDAAKYWRNTLLIAIPLLGIPLVNLIAIGWLVHRIRKYNELRKREQAKLVSRLNTRYANIMLRNNKAIVNAEITGEDERFIRVVDGSGKELLINKNDISILEPIVQELD